MEDSGLFDTPTDRPARVSDGRTLEQRLDALADAAKEATQSAGKLRLALSRIAENALTGSIGSAQGRISKLSESMAELSSSVARISEESAGLNSAAFAESEFLRALESELTKKGIKPIEGPRPYWLVYPSWYKIEPDSKGSFQVVLNGERLESIRPTVVAFKIAEAVNEKFNAKQFKELLIGVRDLFRRAGANGATLMLDDVYEVLATSTGRRSSRAGDLSKSAFYYSVHRLAEGDGRLPGPALSFPPADRSEEIFFTIDRESRKYRTVDFTGAL